MLVIKAYVNYDKIEEIWVHNLGYRSGDICEYAIEKPEGYNNLSIYHKRSDGWKMLATKAFKILEERKPV